MLIIVVGQSQLQILSEMHQGHVLAGGHRDYLCKVTLSSRCFHNPSVHGGIAM